MARRSSRQAGAAAPAARRRLLAVGATALAAVAAFAWLWHAARLPGAAFPIPGPIILISIDTLRADRLPAYGYTALSTPAIDALAADGVLFERACAHSPLTLPSHASIFSGRLPFEHGVRDNLGFTVRPDEPLLAERLRERGFTTGAAVSAYVLRGETGIARGFDEYDDRLASASPELPLGQLQRNGEVSLTALQRWLEAQTSPRVFAFLHLFEPHSPYEPPERFAQYAPYDGEVAYADEIVGNLLEWLRARGLYEQATIVLLSDHGEGLGDHGEQEHGIFLYDSTIRVPLIVKLPGNRAAGRRVADAVQHIDVLPTLLDLAGAPAPDGLRGRSLRPLLEGGRLERVPAYAESLYPRYQFGWSELYSITGEQYRYIRAPQEELYDLQADPGERQNLAAERARTVADMSRALDSLLAGAAIEAPAEVAQETRARLHALGYVSLRRGTAEEAEPGLPDPKDRIDVLERYRRAAELSRERRFGAAVALLEELVTDDPDMVDAWHQLGVLRLAAGRTEQAVDAFKQLVALRPSSASALVNVASGLLKLERLDEAWEHAKLAADVADADSPRWNAEAHDLLARIALARSDADGALRHARLAQQADPTLPMSDFVQGRLLHAAGRYVEALAHFETAVVRARQRTLAMPELHFYAGDTLGQIERYTEAEAQFREEIRLFPQNLRARASLALLYRAAGRNSEASDAIDRLLEAAPTPEGYALAARVWDIVGEPERAARLRAEGRQRFAGDPTVRLLGG